MEIYYIIFIISFLLCFFDFVKIKQVKTIIYTLFSILLFFIIGGRKVGIDNDSQNYEDVFYFYQNVSIMDVWIGGYGYMERGYVSLNKIIGFFWNDFRVLLFSISIISCFTIYGFILKKSILPFFSLLFYLSFFFIYRDFTQIRYALSCGLIFWCCHFYICKKYKISVLFFLLALSFHNTTIIIIPSIIFIYLVRRKIFYIISIIPCALIGFLYNPLPLLLASGLSNDHMQLYKNEEGGGGLAISIIGTVIIILYYLLLKFNKNEINNIEVSPYFGDFYFKLVALSISLNFLFIQSAIFQRFSMMLFQFVVVLFPLVLLGYKKISKQKVTFIFLYIFSTIFLLIYGLRMIDENLIRPYIW